MVAFALPILVGFGLWQLQRMQWKEALLLELAANSSAPVLDLGIGPIPESAQFRSVRLRLRCKGGPSSARAGRNLQGQSGYSHIQTCRAGMQPVLLDTGWSARPDPVIDKPVSRAFKGTLVRTGEGGWLLVSSDAVPPLVPSAAPGPDTISNNHLSYAIQWFSFAAILAVIYALYLRRWKLAPAPPTA